MNPNITDITNELEEIAPKLAELPRSSKTTHVPTGYFEQSKNEILSKTVGTPPVARQNLTKVIALKWWKYAAAVVMVVFFSYSINHHLTQVNTADLHTANEDILAYINAYPDEFSDDLLLESDLDLNNEVMLLESIEAEDIETFLADEDLNDIDIDLIQNL